MKVRRKEEKLREIIPASVRNDIKEYLLNSGQRSFYFFCQFTFKMLIRPAETFKLKIRDIDYNNRLLLLRADDAKDHDNRTYAIPDEIFDYLLQYKELPDKTYIFSTDYKPGINLHDSRYSGRSWSLLRRALKLSDRFTLYSLKDTGITELLNSGVPARIVQQLAGHSSIEMTEKYAHKMRAKEILKYNNLTF
jgi:integrase